MQGLIKNLILQKNNTMNKFVWVLAFAPLLGQAQSHSLEKLWETDSIVAVPESVHADPSKPLLYVSLIDGGGWDVDGKGGVGLLNPDGTHYVGDWITGLNAPKGMGIYGDRLYVADIGDVVVIDRKKGVLLKKIAIEGASGLNDISVDPDNGAVYVSDSKTGKLYKIEKDVPTLYMDKLSGINGLKVSKKGLYILAKKQVLLADASKNISTITDLPNGGDGVEEVGNGDLIVSEWIGNVFYVYSNGEKEQLLDRKAEHKNTADIWYVQSSKTLYVPGFNGKTVTAYRLADVKKN
jgi:DNA-binding beta-propeller fold protein YncE